MFDLSGRTALVTGASGGIGAAIARSLSHQGARVALSGRRLDALEAVAADLGETAVVVPADLSSADAADALVKAAGEALEGLDILIHNAGVASDGLAMRMSDEDWNRVIDVNLTTGFRLTRAALRGMMRKRWGRIVAITSIVGTSGNPGQMNYAASKSGLVGMIKSVAQEVASRGVTANCVAPGLIETDMTADIPDDRKAAIVGAIPVGRAGTPDDVAACVAFLSSDEAAYVTGQTLHVNGGMAMI